MAALRHGMPCIHSNACVISVPLILISSLLLCVIVEGTVKIASACQILILSQNRSLHLSCGPGQYISIHDVAAGARNSDCRVERRVECSTTPANISHLPQVTACNGNSSCNVFLPLLVTCGGSFRTSYAEEILYRCIESQHQVACTPRLASPRSTVKGNIASACRCPNEVQHNPLHLYCGSSLHISITSVSAGASTADCGVDRSVRCSSTPANIAELPQVSACHGQNSCNLSLKLTVACNSIDKWPFAVEVIYTCKPNIGRVFGSIKTIASSTDTHDSTTKRSTMATTGKEVVTTQSTTVGTQPSSVSTTNYILRTTGSTTKDSISAVRPTTKEDNNDTLTIATIANLCVLTTIVCIILFLKLVKPKMSRSSPSQNPYSSSHVEHNGEAESDHYNYLSAIPSNTHSNVNSLGHSESQEYASVNTFGTLEDDPPRDVS